MTLRPHPHDQRRGAPLRAVVLPGSGSDADFAGRALGPALTAAGVEATLLDPEPGGVVRGYRQALDTAASHGPVLVAGISLGALVGLRWAAVNPGAVAGLVLAMPPWTGPAPGSPAATSARATADAVERDGLEPVLATVAASAPAWLHAELSRAWRARRGDLVAALREAAALDGPSPGELAAVTAPTGLGAAREDPLHPPEVAHDWAAGLARAVVVETTLAAVGADPAELGRVTVRAWARAARRG